MSWKVTHRLSFVTSPCTLDQVGQRVGGEREEASVLQTGPHLKITTFDATEVTLKPKCVGCGFSGSHLARHSSSQHREAVHTRGNHIHRWVNNRRQPVRNKQVSSFLPSRRENLQMFVEVRMDLEEV